MSRAAILICALGSAALGGCGGAPPAVGELTVGQRVASDTRGAPDRWRPSCGDPRGGGDEAWRFVPQESGTYRITLEARYDAVLAVLQDGEEIACNDDRGPRARSQVVVELEAGQACSIVVDGYQGATGSYELRVDSEANLRHIHRP